MSCGVRLAVLLFLCGLATPGRAQDVRTLTPDACVRIAVEERFAVRASRHEEERRMARFAESRTSQWPALRANASYRRISPNVPEFAVDLPELSGVSSDRLTIFPSILDHYALEANVEHVVFTAGERMHRVRADRLQASSSRHARRDVEVEVAFEVRSAYWDLVEAEAREETLETAMRHVAEQVRVVRQRHARGAALAGDVLALEARHAEIEVEERNAAARVQVARWHLSDRMGWSGKTAVRPAVRTVRHRPLRMTTDELVAEALSQREDLRALESDADARVETVRGASSARWPTVSLLASYLFARPNPSIVPLQEEFDGTWEVGVRMSFDVWDWNRKGFREEQARHEAALARERVEMRRSRLWMEVAQARLDVERAHDVWTATRTRETATAEVYRVMRRRHQEGAALTTEVLAAELAHREAGVAVVEAESAYAKAQAWLDRVTGSPALEPWTPRR